MSEIRKHKEIIVFFLILTMVVFAKQSGSYVHFSAGYKINSVKESHYKHIPIIAFTKEIKHVSCSNLIKKVCFEKAILKSPGQLTTLLPSYPVSRYFHLLVNASVLTLNCILRI
jgi:hypothetical protein